MPDDAPTPQSESSVKKDRFGRRFPFRLFPLQSTTTMLVNRFNAKALSENFLYSPIAPLLLTALLVLLRLPFSDLPIWDDATIYFNGYSLLNGQLQVLNFQWQPVLVFLNAGINYLLPATPILGFILFHLIGQVTVALGAYTMLRALEYAPPQASCLACVWVFLTHVLCVIAGYPTLHLYHAGVPLLIGAYVLRRRPVSLCLSIGLALLAFWVRNEALLVVILFILAGALRRRAAGAPVWRKSEWYSAALWTAQGLLILILAQEPLNLQSGRLEYAFRQQFYRYAQSIVQYDAVLPPTRERELNVLEAAFGPNAREKSIHQLFISNPSAFLGFMGSNVVFIMRGDLFGNHHYLLSRFCLLALLTGLLCLAFSTIRMRDGFRFWLLLGIVAKVPLFVLTVPRLYYAGDIFFIGIFGLWKLCFPNHGWRIAKGLAATAVLLAAVSLGYGPHLETSGRPNLERALFIREAAEQYDLTNLLLAEYYGPFSKTFGTRDLDGSVSLYMSVQSIGGRIYSGQGRLFDLVLLEDDTPVREEVRRWEQNQMPILERDGFRLYRQERPTDLVTPPGPTDRAVWVTDDYDAAEDLSGGIDHDSSANRQLAIKWNYNLLGVTPAELSAVQVWVRMDDGEEHHLLGAPFRINMPFLEWRLGSKLVEPEFEEGPQFGKAYQFEVALYFKDDSRPPLRAANAAPVLFLPFITVTHNLDDVEDHSLGEILATEDERRLVIHWTLDPEEIDVENINHIHVYMRENDSEGITYLGRLVGAEQSAFVWEPGNPMVHLDYRDGPRFGASYEFHVYLLEGPDKPLYPPFRNAGPVRLVRKE